MPLCRIGPIPYCLEIFSRARDSWKEFIIFQNSLKVLGLRDLHLADVIQCLEHRVDFVYCDRCPVRNFRTRGLLASVVQILDRKSALDRAARVKNLTRRKILVDGTHTKMRQSVSLRIQIKANILIHSRVIPPSVLVLNLVMKPEIIMGIFGVVL